jgi:hypothetical protein
MLLNTSYSTRPLDLERAAFEPARRDDLDSTSSGESIVPGEEKEGSGRTERRWSEQAELLQLGSCSC